MAAMVIAVGVLAGCGRNGTRGSGAPERRRQCPFLSRPSSRRSWPRPHAPRPERASPSPARPRRAQPARVQGSRREAIRTTSRRRRTAGSVHRPTGRKPRPPRPGDRRRPRDPLGAGSAPHGVITGPDGAAWITDGGLNAIVRVDPATDEVRVFRSRRPRRRKPQHGRVRRDRAAVVHRAERDLRQPGSRDGRDHGSGTRPRSWAVRHHRDAGRIDLYASLAGNHIARIDPTTGVATVVEPPTAIRAPRRVWSDRTGRIWVSEWKPGQVAVHDPTSGTWREMALPGKDPMAYAVFVDDRDVVWLTDFGGNAIVRFDPADREVHRDRVAEPGRRSSPAARDDPARCGAPVRDRQARRRDRWRGRAAAAGPAQPPGESPSTGWTDDRRVRMRRVRLDLRPAHRRTRRSRALSAQGPRSDDHGCSSSCSSRIVVGVPLLDIGGGVGIIDRELLRAGAGHAVLVDGSAAYLEVAARGEPRRAA